MKLTEAIEILRKEQRICKIISDNGFRGERDENFIEAVDTVLEFLDRFICLLIRPSDS